MNESKPSIYFLDENGKYPEWEKKNLGDIVDIIGGGTPDTTNSELWGGSISWFSPAELGSKKYVAESERTITDKGLKSSSAKILPKGAVLLTTRASLGKMAILTQPACTNQGFQSLIPKESILGEFVYYLQPGIVNYLNKNASGSTFKEISGKQVSKMPIYLPSLSEQKKIAEFFTLLDRRIEKQAEKVEALKEYKKGLQQKIFNRELVFTDDNGDKYPEWEEKTLGEMAIIKRGKGLSKASLTADGKNDCILYGELFTKYGVSITKTISKTNDISPMNSRVGDILMPTSDVTPIGLATASSISIDNVLLGSDMNIIRLVDNSIDSMFLTYAINHFPKKIIDKVSGTTVKHIYARDLLDITYTIPNYAEQEKIVNLLVAYDSTIDRHTEKLVLLKEQKKGYLQKMFV